MGESAGDHRCGFFQKLEAKGWRDREEGLGGPREELGGGR